MIGGSKWWWPLMINLVNITIVAAWKFYCALHPEEEIKMTLLEFRREIALVLVRSKSIRQSQGGKHADLPGGIRYDGKNHEPTSCSQD
ncbi:hypothetical protein SK128_013730, partial [Halocaridina rubra]